MVTENNKISGPHNTGLGVEGSLPLSQFKLYIDVYTRHFDIFLKGVIIYLALLGGVAGFIYHDNVTFGTKVTLSVMASILSLIMFVACLMSRLFLIDLKIIIDEVADELGIRRFPFSGAMGVILGATAGTVVFCVAGALNLYLLLR